LPTSGFKYKIKAGGASERPEVPVSREERNTSIDTALGDQRVAEARLAALGQRLRPQGSCPLPVARSDLDERHFRERFGNAGWKARIAQQLGEHNRHHEHLPVFHRPVEEVGVLASAAF